jgi:hypothetical protein
MAIFSSTHLGVDVMITNFCDFCQFSAKKMPFFSKTNVMLNFFQKLAVVLAKNANIFAKFFGENILKNHNIGPWSHWTDTEMLRLFPG